MSYFPCSPVDHLAIIVNKVPLFIPRCVTEDLSDLTTAELSADGDKGVLVLNGGHAGESYILKIEFNAKGLLRTSLFDGESPKRPAQVTTYNQDIE